MIFPIFCENPTDRITCLFWSCLKQSIQKFIIPIDRKFESGYNMNVNWYSVFEILRTMLPSTLVDSSKRTKYDAYDLYLIDSTPSFYETEKYKIM